MVHQERYPQEAINFDRFYRENKRVLRGYIGARTGGSVDADDLTSEVMCQFLDYCRRTEQPIPYPRALLYKIAKNRLADYYAERRLRQREISIEDAPPVAAPGSIIAMIAADERLRAVHAVLPSLHESYREILTLHAVVGLPISEIAEAMEKPAVHVRVLLFRARRALRRALRSGGYAEYAETLDQP